MNASYSPGAKRGAGGEVPEHGKLQHVDVEMNDVEPVGMAQHAGKHGQGPGGVIANAR